MRRATNKISTVLITGENFYPRSPCGERRGNESSEDANNGNFYPRSPCGERRQALEALFHVALISIHALLAESDSQFGVVFRVNGKFLSTLSLRRATPCLSSWDRLTNFYPRSPCGERPLCFIYVGVHKHFYPRSPCGERLKPEQYGLKWTCISIHALIAESD